MRHIRYILFVLVTTLFGQTPTYTISTLAGIDPTGDNSPAVNARLLRPEGIVVDPQGVVYFSDRGNGRIRRIGVDQMITTVAGGGEAFAREGLLATSVRIYDPIGVAINATAQTLYFSDTTASTVYSVNLATGILSTVAGTGLGGSIGDGAQAKNARLNQPRGLAYNATLGLLIADTGNDRVRRVNLTTGVISAFAGTGTPDFGGDGGPATAAQLDLPYGVAVGPDLAVYIADYGNSRVRRVKSDNTIDTIAGTGSTRFSGDGGPAASAAVDAYQIAAAADGTIYLADSFFQRVRRITPAGIISTMAGNGSFGFAGDGGPAGAAQFDAPHAVAVDVAGNVYIADTRNHRLRRITIGNSIIDTIGGRNRFGGEAVQASLALLTEPQDVGYDAAGNLYFADSGNHCVRRVGRDGLVTIVAGIGGAAGRGGENIPATLSRLDNPNAIAVDSDGTVYISDRGNARIRRVDPAGNIATITNQFYLPNGLALQTLQKRLYFTDALRSQVLRMDLSTSIPEVSAIAGVFNFAAGYAGDGGPATAARLRSPAGIAVAPNGDVYFADAGNQRLRRVDSGGTITTIAGNGEIEILPSDGPITSAVLSLPGRVAIDAQSNIFVSEAFNRIRRISAGRIDTIAGEFLSGFSGDSGPARQAKLNGPAGLAVAPDGSVVFADSFNHRLRRLTVGTAPVIPTPAVATRLEIRAGNNQTGSVSRLLPQALSVASLSATNTTVAATPVAFAVTAGAATLSAASANTGSDGVASITVTLGATVGPVQITARSGALTPVVFSLTATAAAPPPVTVVLPIISRGGILGVGVSVPAVSTISPRGIITIFGQNFLETGIAGRRVDFTTESAGGLLPTRLLGVCVEIGGVRAPMLDAFGTQLNVVVPMIAGPTAAVRVIRRCDQPDAVISAPETVPVAPAAPEFLYSQLNLDGRNPVAAVNAVNGALIGPASLPGFVPAQPGDILTIYATGFGATDPAFAPGGTSPGVAAVTASVRIRIGTVDLTPADILYSGASPGLLIYQVNLRVPAGLPSGNLPVQIFLNDVPSPVNAYLALADGPSAASASPEQIILQMHQSRNRDAERQVEGQRKQK